jgi:CSLREA domain-containing protein
MERREARRGRRGPGRRRGIAAALAAVVARALAPGAHAASFVVDSTDDDDDGSCAAPDCTLREAVFQTREVNSPGPDQITFAPSLNGSTITLTHEPFTDSPLTITGPGADQLTISGGGAFGIFWFDTAPGDDVTVSGLTLTNGLRAAGGAIFSVDPDLTLRDVALRGNAADNAGGGGLYAVSGLDDRSGSLTIERSEITENTATSPAFGAGGTGFLARGIGSVVVRNTTISDNMATSPGMGGQALGGGVELENMTSPLVFENSTIADNSISHSTNNAYGGGINNGTSSAVVLRNTIVAGNMVSGFPGEGPDLRGAFDIEFSLVGDTTDVAADLNETVPGSNILDEDPLLVALADNGGPTRTQELGIGSPARDAGRSYCATTDQRGEPFGRPSDLTGTANSTAAGADGSDIGAYEQEGDIVSVPPLCVPPPQPQPTAAPSHAVGFGKLKRNKKKGIAFLFVKVPGPGQLGLAGPGLRPLGLGGAAKALAVAGGTVKLRIAPHKKGRKARKLRKRLKRKGKARVKARVTYVPSDGAANTKVRKLKLIRKR